MRIVLMAHKPIDVSEITKRIIKAKENDVRRELFRLAGEGNVIFTAEMQIEKGRGIPIRDENASL
jgi:hypothetical protein